MCIFHELADVRFGADSHLEEIGEYAFGHTELFCVSIPKRVRKIGAYCFQGCHLVHFELTHDSELEVIGQDAFSCCRLAGLFIPPKLSMVTGLVTMSSVVVTMPFYRA